MHHRYPLALTGCLLAACAMQGTTPPASPTVRVDRISSTPPTRAAADPGPTPSLAEQPVHYVANTGQWPDRIRYRAALRVGSVTLRDDGWTLAHGGETVGASVHMHLHGAAPAPLIPEGLRSGRHNYFLGTDPSRWRADVPLYQSVRYQQPYPHVDVRARAVDGLFEYDLLLTPEADLSVVQIAIEGASSVRSNGQGGLVMETRIGQLTQQPPVTWQTSADGQTRRLTSRCVLLGDDRFGFEVDGWDRQSTLTVDPGLLWSTFLGGSGGAQPWDDLVRAVSVDEDGIVTVAGVTLSPDFPTLSGALSPAYNGGDSDVFVTRFDPSRGGSAQLLYSTFIGGDGTDTPGGLWVSPNGVVTIAGRTDSATTFPTTTGAYDTTYNGGPGDAFVSRLDPSASGSAQLLYSTLLGGEDLDRAVGLSVDAADVITVVGYTASTLFPTNAGYDSSYNGGSFDFFVSQLDPAATGAAQLRYSTYLGGSGIDAATAVAVDGAGVITIVGSTTDPSFPVTAGVLSSTVLGPKDAVVSQLDPALVGSAQLVYSTFLGGFASDQANAVAVDSSGLVTITGITSDNSFPTTATAYDQTYNGGNWDAFITQIDPKLSASAQLVYSTLLGGSSGDFGLSLGIDSRGTITIGGEIGGFQSNFPTTAGAHDREFGGGGGDAYVARIDPARTGAEQLIYSTFLGANQYDRGMALALGPDGVIIGGGTASGNFPATTGAFETTYNGGPFDGFVSLLDMLPAGVLAYGASSPGCDGPLIMSVTSMPKAGNSAFTLLCNDAPAGAATGFVILAAGPASPPTTIFGVDLWVNLAGANIVLPAAANARGASDVALPIPSGPSIVGATLFAQFLWIGPAAPPPCPPGGLSASNALSITIQ